MNKRMNYNGFATADKGVTFARREWIGVTRVVRV